MPEDSYTEVSHQSWFSRLGGAFKGIFFGLILVLGAFFLLFWNEGRAVERYKTLEEGAGAVVAVSADAVDPGREGALVHVSGRAETDRILRDETFGVAEPALRLVRQVEMYQWEENEQEKTEKKGGGSTTTTTTYSYDKTWSERAIDSSRFHQPAGHENPGALPWEGREVTADPVTLGGFRLSHNLVRKIDRWEDLPVASAGDLPADLRQRARLHDGGLYVGEGEPGSPQIGDVRIRFRVVRPTEVSVISQQAGDGFRPFQAKAGGTLELLELGTVPAEEMFAAAQRRNTLLTWALRLGGFLLMAMGFGIVLRPLSVLADVVPFIGNLVGAGTGIVAFLLSGFLSLITIAVAWLFYRPLLAMLLVAVAVAAITWLVLKVRKARAERQAPAGSGYAAPPPPPPAAASAPAGSPPPPPPPGGPDR